LNGTIKALLYTTEIRERGVQNSGRTGQSPKPVPAFVAPVEIKCGMFRFGATTVVIEPLSQAQPNF
jgi:hypothetical protein